MSATTIDKTVNTSPAYSKQLRRFGGVSLITLFASIVLMSYLMPFAYMFVTSFKTRDQIVASATGSIFPMDPIVHEYTSPEGEIEQLEVFEVPLEDGTVLELALLQKGRNESTFVDPANPDAEPIVWEGRWRTLTAVKEFAPQWGNFSEVWELADFPRLLFNTTFVAISGVIGTLLSSICVAYAFARFPIPGKRILFLILVSTIILPPQVMLIPTFAFFKTIGWVGTTEVTLPLLGTLALPLGWLPLIVPHFFANGYNVFLLRQYFLGLPRELDEAAMIDGAGPFRVLVSVIIPQSWPVIVAVSLFHLVFAWNDYFLPLIYTLGHNELQPIAVGIQQFNFQYNQQPQLIQATALLGMVVPVLLFFVAQRFFMQGIVVTGVEK